MIDKCWMIFFISIQTSHRKIMAKNLENSKVHEMLKEFRYCFENKSNRSIKHCEMCDSLKTLSRGLVYNQLYHGLATLQVTEAVGLRQKDGLLLAKAAEEIGRLDLQLDWLEWAKVDGSLLQEAKERSDEVLEKGGGFSYNSSSLTFLVSRPHLHRRRQPEEEEQTEKRRQAQLRAVENMPHDRDMFDDPAYMNRLAVVRTDLSADLCQGNTSRRLASLDSHVHCHRQLHIHPYLRLCPHMVEELNRRPYIALFHRFSSTIETQSIIEEARAEGLDSSRYLVGGNVLGPSNKRSSKVAYLPDSSSSTTQSLATRTVHALRLQPTRGDNQPLQVMRYSLGGNIQPHLDTRVTSSLRYRNGSQDFASSGGDRLATVMLYLTGSPKPSLSRASTVSGGATVFPQLGLSVQPVGGAALVWFTVRSCGRPDSRLLHMGCPVLGGNKWIANRWVNWQDQMFSYPCKRQKSLHFSLRR